MNSISLMVLEILRLSSSSQVNFNSLWFLENWNFILVVRFMCIVLVVVFTCYSFNVCEICNAMLSFIPDIINSCVLSLFFLVLEVYQFYWCFQRTALLVLWIFTVFVFKFSLLLLFLCFCFYCLIWVYLLFC